MRELSIAVARIIFTLALIPLLAPLYEAEASKPKKLDIFEYVSHQSMAYRASVFCLPSFATEPAATTLLTRLVRLSKPLPNEIVVDIPPPIVNTLTSPTDDVLGAVIDISSPFGCH